ncbi:MAG: CDP-ribitol ribitolphosphotransferase / teichoic acid ribitol-phosphate polymerase [Petrotoga sp.]|nr:CDP-ribitol ribitolphosphotransferase / teichoic acid ribitol-phosphate polymerase [Petrotoga sp.]
MFNSSEHTNRISLINYGFSGSNSIALFKYIKSSGVDFEVKLIPHYVLEKYKEYISSSALVFTTFRPIKFHDKQICVQGWHGFPLKTLGLLDKKDQQNKQYIKEMCEHSDVILSYSPLYNTLFNSCFPSTLESYVITGMPRNDFLFLPKERSVEMLSKITGLPRKEIEERKILLYTPTYRATYYRKDSREISEIIMNLLTNEFVDFVMRNNLIFFIKTHPSEEKRAMRLLNEVSNQFIRIIQDSDLEKYFIDFYEILPAVDLLITDYSSIYFDWLLTGKPVIFFTPDLETYAQNRDFLLEPLEIWMPGPICKESKQLIKCIEEALDNHYLHDQKKQFVIDNVHFFKDGNSSKRVVELFDQILKNLYSLPKTKLFFDGNVFKTITKLSYNYLKSLIQEEKYDQVVELFEKSYIPTESYHFLALAISLAHLGRITEALEHARKASELNPKDPEVMLNLAELYYINNQLREAAETAIQALNLVGEDTFMFDILSDYYRYIGENSLAERFEQLALENAPNDIKSKLSLKYGDSPKKTTKTVLILGNLTNWEILYEFTRRNFDIVMGYFSETENPELMFARSVGARIISFENIDKVIDVDKIDLIICFGNLPDPRSVKPHSLAKIMRYLYEFEKITKKVKSKRDNVPALFVFNSKETAFENKEFNEVFYRRICHVDYVIFPTNNLKKYFELRFPDSEKIKKKVMLADTFNKNSVVDTLPSSLLKLTLYFPNIVSYDPLPRPIMKEIGFDISKLSNTSFLKYSSLLNEFKKIARGFVFGLGPFFNFYTDHKNAEKIFEEDQVADSVNPKEIYSMTNVPQEVLLYLIAGVIPILPDNGNDFYKQLAKNRMALIVEHDCEYLDPTLIDNNVLLEFKRNILRNTELYTTERFMRFIEEIIK